MDVEEIVREYVEKTIHMSLATSENNRPWVCEVHFAVDDELNIYWRSKSDRRHSQEIAKNPSVAGNIVKQHVMNEGPAGIYFEGEAELLVDVDENHPAFIAFDGRFGLGREIIDDSLKDDGHKFYKVTVKNWYAFGKFDGESNKKYKLEWNK